MNHDIALIIVEDQFHFSDFVQPIKLPTIDLEAGTLVEIAGYGSTNVKVRH